jgi:type IV pilus assembly protein PilM
LNLRRKLHNIICYLQQDLSGDLKVGFDLGTHSLKTAVVDQTRGRIVSMLEIKNINDRQSKDEVADKSDIQDKILRMVERYKRIIPKFANKTSAVIQGEGIVSNYITIPNVSDNEMETVITSKAINFIPFPIEEVNVDFIKVPPINPREKDTGLFFVAAKKQIIQNTRDFLSSCGLKVEGVETPIFPLIREFKKNQKFHDDKFIALVHIGFRYSYVIIVKNGYPYFSRELRIAGADFTYAFQAHNQVNWKEAEKLKMKVDLENPSVAIKPFIEELLREIDKSIRFFENQYKQYNIKVEKIYLSGGGAGLKNLDSLIFRHQGIETTIDRWEIFKTARRNQNNAAYRYKIAVGLTIK